MLGRFDQQYNLSYRTIFISGLSDKNLQENVENLGASTELTNMMDDIGEFLDSSGKLNLINSKGPPLDNFNINIPDRFKHIVKKIDEISMDHIVRVNFRKWR